MIAALPIAVSVIDDDWLGLRPNWTFTCLLSSPNWIPQV